MKTLTIDIETIPDQNLPEDLRPVFDKGRLVDPEKIKAAEEQFNADLVKKLSVNPMTLQIVSLQMLDDNGFCKTPNDERESLGLFWEEADRHDLFIGHNILDFDLTAIFMRSMVHKIKPTKKISLKRYQTRTVFDTMKILGNWTNYIKLDDALMRFGISKKSGSGSEVYQRWLEKDYEWINDYCKLDTLKAKELYNILSNFY